MLDIVIIGVISARKRKHLWWFSLIAQKTSAKAFVR